MGRCVLVALALSLLIGVAVAKPRRSKGTPPADPPPAPVDISQVQDVLEVFHDGKGHYLALVPFKHKLPKPLAPRDFVFYGDGKVFYRVYAPSAGHGKADYYFAADDPRIPWGQSRFAFRDGVAQFTCEKRHTVLSKLDPVKETALIKGAKFLGRFWRRTPRALARDDDGTYYYVDQMGGTDEITETPQGLRVFMGQRGRLRFLPMKNLVVDPAGEIFITADGSLKLVIDYATKKAVEKATWVSKKERRVLTVVNLGGSSRFRSRLFIYRDFGVYAGLKLHLPCDDW